MKRLIAMLLLLALLLISCDDQSTESSTADLSEEATSEAISEEISELEEFVFSEKVEKINELMTEDVDRTLNAKNRFDGKSYTVSKPANDKYPDPNLEKLTNNQFMDVIYGHYNYVGWNGSDAVTITIDAGEDKHKIADVVVRTARIKAYDIGTPKYVMLYASNDNQNFVEIGKIFAPTDLPDSGQYSFYFSLAKATTARYFRVLLGPNDSHSIAVDEILGLEYSEEHVYENILGKKEDIYYSIEDFYDYNLNLGESNVKVSESDADYNELRNLATIEGVDFQIEHFDPFFKGHTNTKKDRIGILTDGKLHGTNLDYDYFIFYRGAGRHVVADLGQIMSVKGCTLSFFDRYDWGITTPVVYYISVSENGTDWVTVAAEHNPDYGKTKRMNDTRNIEFKDEFRARYVRLTFPTQPDDKVSCQVYMGEWEIIGRKNPANAKTATYDVTIPYGRYPDVNEIGADNILWAGIANEVGEHVDGDYHNFKEETAYAYLCLTGEDGKAEKVLFDSVAFTTRGPISFYPERNEGYTWFLDELFYEGLNLDALEAAKGRINEELGTNDKLTVWIGVNCPEPGEIFNGKKIETADDYIACQKWMTDEAIKRFKAKKYKNLELIGFYWVHETLRPNIYTAAEGYYDTEAMIAFNKYVHSLGYKTLWAPYYAYVQGIWNAVYYGVDVTCLQPNYMWLPAPYTRLNTVAELAKIYGIGIEVECEALRPGEEMLDMYREYLSAGYRHGYMNAVNTFYQGAIPGLYVVYRDSEEYYSKTMHDEGIAFILGELDHDPLVKEPVDISKFEDEYTITVKNGRTSTINLGSFEGIKNRFTLSPKYGGVRLNNNGDLSFSAMSGYKGEDYLEITVFDGVSERRTIKIKIDITA